jgi:hypothetical protein
MRLRIEMTGVEFRVAGAPREKKDWKDKSRQATTPDGRPIWLLRLSAYDEGNKSTETIWVEFAGEEPQVIPNEVATIQGLTYAPWVSKNDKTDKYEIVRWFRAEAITHPGAARRSAA